MHYIALGDSISIDEYPDQEVGTKGNGAASRFWGLLRHSEGPMGFTNLTQDGASIRQVMESQLPRAKHLRNKKVIITVTMGGNDISFRSMDLLRRKKFHSFSPMLDDVRREYTDGLIGIRRMFPNSHIITNTLYDPTDGTGKLPEDCGAWADIGPYYSAGRRYLGKYIREWSKYLPFVTCADVFRLFDGKGMSIENRDGYYYSHFLIEPGVVGAAKIADLWLQSFRSATKQEVRAS